MKYSVELTFLKGTLSLLLAAPTTHQWKNSIFSESAYDLFSCFSAVPLSCAAEVRNTLPAAFSLVEKVTDPGFHLITASHTYGENGDVM